MATSPVPVSDASFLRGGGEMGALMRAHDWSASPLGDPATWPQSLRSVVGLLLGSKLPMLVAWGDELGLLYNDACIEILGEKHPQALGGRLQDVWAEIWSDIGPLADAALAGEAVYRENLPLVVNRKGHDEQTWFTFSYSPAPDESGRIAGMFCACTETTAHVLAERRQAYLLDLERRLREARTAHTVLDAACEAIGRGLGGVLCTFNELDEAAGHLDVTSEWRAGHTPSALGRHRLADWGPDRVADLLSGHPERVEDVKADPRTAGTVAEVGYAALGCRSSLNVPLVREGRVRAMVAVGVAQPHYWTEQEVSLVCETAERVWQAAERARAEGALRENERELRFALDAGRFGAWRLDLATGELTASKTCRTNFGRDPGLPFSYAELRDAVHPDDKARMAAAVEESIATGGVYDIEYRIVTPAGEVRWVQIRAQPIQRPDGAVTEMAGVSIDVTQRREAEVELRNRESRLRLAVEAGRIGEWELDLATDTAVRARRHDQIFGHDEPVADWGFESFIEHVVPEDRQGVEVAFKTATETGTGWHFECRIRRANDGELRWIAAHSAPQGDEAGRATRLFGLVQDITEQRRAEERLRELNATLEVQVAERTSALRLYRDIVQSDEAPVVAFDTEYRLIAFNKAHDDAFFRVFAHRAQVGEMLLDRFPADQRTILKGLMDRALAGETFTVVEEFGDPGIAKSYFDITYTPMRDEAGRIVGAFHHAKDITARVRAQAELEAAQEALRQSQKMEAMGSLTGGVAHDFNNLLTPIVGSLDMLQRKGLGGEREQRLIAGAMQSAERAKTLVQRLLAFARRQPLQAVPVDIAKLVAGMGDLVASTTGPQIRVVVEASDDLPPAKADPNQIEMALLNLSVNARDAMPEGGTLRISASAESVGAGHRSKLRTGHYIRLSVADTGAGMDEATISRAVEPFFSTKGVGKGTGLGLSMVHGLASQLGGALTIQSRPGLGTNVELWLPRSSLTTDAAEVAQEPVSPAAQSGTALLVDDEELVRMSTADMLNDLGYAVIEAASGEEALHLIHEGRRFDLLVTDHLMPGMTGTDLAHAVRSARPGMPVLLVSGYAESEGIEPSLPRLTKPFRKDELAARLAHLSPAS